MVNSLTLYTYAFLKYNHCRIILAYASSSNPVPSYSTVKESYKENLEIEEAAVEYGTDVAETDYDNEPQAPAPPPVGKAHDEKTVPARPQKIVLLAKPTTPKSVTPVIPLAVHAGRVRDAIPAPGPVLMPPAAPPKSATPVTDEPRPIHAPMPPATPPTSATPLTNEPRPIHAPMPTAVYIPNPPTFIPYRKKGRKEVQN